MPRSYRKRRQGFNFPFTDTIGVTEQLFPHPNLSKGARGFAPFSRREKGRG